MTSNTQEVSKSRRAHSPCLAQSEREPFFDADEFCKAFTEINPDIVVWDSIRGESA